MDCIQMVVDEGDFMNVVMYLQVLYITSLIE